MNYTFQKIFYIIVSLVFTIGGIYSIDNILISESNLSSFSKYSAVCGFAIAPLIVIFCFVSLVKGWTKEEEAIIAENIISTLISPFANLIGFAMIILVIILILISLWYLLQTFSILVGALISMPAWVLLLFYLLLKK